MERLNIRKLRIFLIRNNNLVTFFKLFMVLFLMFLMNLNKNFISYMFYLLIFDVFMLNQKERRLYKYLLNIMMLIMLFSERLLHCSNNFAVVDIIISILYIFVILLAIKVDLIANRVTLWNYGFRRIIKKNEVLMVTKIITIISMLLLVRVNLIIILFVATLNLLQLFIGTSEVDKIKKTIIDLLIFLISALTILFKTDVNAMVENLDMLAILGILAIIVFYWIRENMK